jgi:CHAT domain-containing protein/Tfp pilus assembly protein PilF
VPVPVPATLPPLALLFAAALAGGASTPADVTPLGPGRVLERELKGAEAHSYEITVEAGQFLAVRVEQRTVDVVAELLDPEGRRLLQVDAQAEHVQPETVLLVAEAAGAYILRVRPAREDLSGAYAVQVQELRPATARDRILAVAERSYEEGVRRRGRGATPTPEALPPLQAALAGYREAGDRRGETKALLTIGSVLFRGGNPLALERATEALAVARSLDDVASSASALSLVGQVRAGRGEMPQALEAYEQAIAGARSIGSRRIEATALSNAGIVVSRTGQAQKALDYYARGLALARTLADRSMQVRLLGNTGAAYYDLADYRSALEHDEEALALARALGDSLAIESRLLNNMGNAHWMLGDQRRALDTYMDSLALARKAGSVADESRVINNIGDAYIVLGEYQKAREHGEVALALKQRLGDLPGQAVALRNLGRASRGLGETARALDQLREALEIQRRIEERYAVPGTLIDLATVERDRGHLSEALAYALEAIERAESLRSLVAGSEARALFAADRQDAYEFHVDLLMRLHVQDPAAGHAAAALQASERARARALLESLIEARADIRQGVDPALLDRERAVQARLSEGSARLSRLLTGKPDAEAVTAARADLERVTADYRRLQVEIRQHSPRYAALTQPQPLGLEAIQRDVLDGETTLLEYMLGEERSYLWVVTSTSLESHELPRRAEIEEAARRVYDLLVTRQRRTGALASSRTSIADADARLATDAMALSRIVLGPIARRLRESPGDRLAVVASGALEYLPFGALPVPVAGDGGRPEPLIATHEVVNLPSASALTEIRRAMATRTKPHRTIAVLADPVFDTGDPRVARTSRAAAPPPSENRAELQRAVRSFAQSPGLLSRLPFSRQEAEAIAALAPSGSVTKLTDFQARRPAVTDGSLSGHSIVHFATHGLLHDEQPELSGLVLSLVDEGGGSQDGFLRMHEIYNLHLPAEVVVLSACQTALGKRIKGEGLVGLTRGFFYAGAARVVASLWQVDDLATAELMKRFYRGMLKEGLRPAAALRAAQREMASSRNWSAPYYWAGFVLQGDWR